MPFYVGTSIDVDEAARQLSNDLRMTLDLLAELATRCPTSEEAEAYAELLAEEYSGSTSDQTVAPFLRVLADALDAAEAGEV